MKAMKKGDKSNVMKTFADGSAAFGLAQPGFEIDGDLLEDEVDEVLGGAQQEDELGIAELVALGEKEYKKQHKAKYGICSTCRGVPGMVAVRSRPSDTVPGVVSK